jgi:hypothetical protein
MAITLGKYMKNIKKYGTMHNLKKEEAYEDF